MDSIMPGGMYGSTAWMDNRSTGQTNYWGVQKPPRMLNFLYEPCTAGPGAGFITCEGRRVCGATSVSDGLGHWAVPTARDMPEMLNMLSMHFQKYQDYFDQTCDEIYNSMAKHANEMKYIKQDGTGSSSFKNSESTGYDRRFSNIEAKMRDFQRMLDMVHWKGQQSQFSPRGVQSTDYQLENKIDSVRKTVEMVETKVHDEQEDLRSEVNHLKRSVKGDYANRSISKQDQYQRLGNLEDDVKKLQGMFEMMQRQFNMDGSMGSMSMDTSFHHQDMDARQRARAGDTTMQEMPMMWRDPRGSFQGSYQYADNSFSNERFQKFEKMIEDVRRWCENELQGVQSMVEMTEKRSRDEQHSIKAELFKMVQSYSGSWQEAGSQYQGSMSPRQQHGGYQNGGYGSGDSRTVAMASPRDHRLGNLESRIDDLRNMIDLLEKKFQTEQKHIQDQGHQLRQFQYRNNSTHAGSDNSQMYEQRFGTFEVSLQDMRRMFEKLDKKVSYELQDQFRSEMRKLKDMMKPDGDRYDNTRSARHGEKDYLEGRMEDLKRTVEKNWQKVNIDQDELKSDMKKMWGMMTVNDGSNNWQSFRSSKQYQGNLEAKVQDLHRTVDKVVVDRQDLQRTVEKVERKMLTDHDELRSEMQKFMQSMKYGNFETKIHDMQRMVERVEQKVNIDNNELRSEVQNYLQNFNFEQGKQTNWQGNRDDWQDQRFANQDQRFANLEQRIHDVQGILEMYQLYFKDYMPGHFNKNFMPPNYNTQFVKNFNDGRYNPGQDQWNSNELPMVSAQRPGGFPHSKRRPRSAHAGMTGMTGMTGVHAMPGVTPVSAAMREMEGEGFSGATMQNPLDASVDSVRQKNQRLMSELQRNDEWFQRSMAQVDGRRPSLDNMNMPGKQPFKPAGSPVQGRPNFQQHINI